MIDQIALHKKSNRKIPPGTPCKIGIMGPHNVGKTTVANLLNGHLKAIGVHADLVPEVARTCPLPLKNRTGVESAYWLYGTQVAAEALVFATRQFTICDRTIIDMYPFAMHTARTLPPDRQAAATDALEGLSALIETYLTKRPYQFLFYLPIPQSNPAPPGSAAESVLQQAVDAEFRAFLRELAVPFHILNGADAQSRVQEIMKNLRKVYQFKESA